MVKNITGRLASSLTLGGVGLTLFVLIALSKLNFINLTSYIEPIIYIAVGGALLGMAGVRGLLGVPGLIGKAKSAKGLTNLFVGISGALLLIVGIGVLPIVTNFLPALAGLIAPLTTTALGLGLGALVVNIVADLF